MQKEIYLAGGCFWGTEKYIGLLNGVTETEVGYANGIIENPTYEQVCNADTGFAETVKAIYDNNIISLSFILNMYYDTVNPVLKNRQGNDIGSQYRTGIYYTDDGDQDVINKSITELQKNYEKKIAIEVLPLMNYYPAEEYHQKYLDKHPAGYCHISSDKFVKAKNAIDNTKAPRKQDLTSLQYEVTYNNGTEPPFHNEYYNNFKQGIYVDITTGEPLFISSDKFESGCGWPSFSAPIDKEVIVEKKDHTDGMSRIEVRSKNSDIHLGHVFEDGPIEFGGLRYCINSASLKFIAIEQMEEEGYGKFVSLIK